MAFQAENLRTAGAGGGPERRADEAYCQSCGNVISREAAICMNCGVATRRVAYNSGVGGVEAKSKTVSVLLAIFVSYFTWIYTYREDSSKFWAGVVINAVMFVLTIFTLGLGVFIWIPVSLGFWIWSIVDVTSKSDAWYANY
jgi:hypothetical protein